MPFVDREDGVRLYWEEQGEGPTVLTTHSYIQHPDVLRELMDDLASDHRVVRYDPRGTGESTRTGPYDTPTDVADMLAVAEMAGPLTAIVTNGDATNRAVHAAAQRSDLIPVVLSLETVPLTAGLAEDTDSLVGSASVLEALVEMMRNDYRSGMMAALQRGNPEMTLENLRERLDRTVEYVPHDAGLARLDVWIRDEPGEDAVALGDRLVIAYEGAGAWFTAELLERGHEYLPEARFERLEGGPISRPDLTAAVVRSVTQAARTSS